MLFPGPGGSEGVLDVAFGLPSEFLVGKGRIRPDGGDVSGSARRYLIIEFQTIRP